MSESERGGLDRRDVSRPASSSASSTSASASSPDPMEYGGGRILGDGFDGYDGDLPSLELNEPAPRPFDAPPGRPAGSAAVSRSFEAPREPGPPSSVGSPSPSFSPGEVAALADYGSAPGGILAAVPYAVLVLTRRLALKRALRDLSKLRATAEQDAKEALVSLGRALHAQRSAEGLRAFAPLIEAADRTGEVAGERTDQWQKSRDAAEAQRASLTAKIAEAEKASGPYKDQETKLATQMTVRDTDLRRAQARLSRVEIELRNVAPEDEPKRALLSAELAARRADLEKAQGHADELSPRLAAARRELTVYLQAINDLEQQRRTIDRAQQHTEKVHLSSAGVAEADYHLAVLELAQAALARGAADPLAPDESKAARTMQSALAARERSVEVHEAALSAYDRPSFQKGAAILGTAALVIVLMIVLVLVR